MFWNAIKPSLEGVLKLPPPESSKLPPTPATVVAISTPWLSILPPLATLIETVNAFDNIDEFGLIRYWEIDSLTISTRSRPRLFQLSQH